MQDARRNADEFEVDGNFFFFRHVSSNPPKSTPSEQPPQRSTFDRFPAWMITFFQRRHNLLAVLFFLFFFFLRSFLAVMCGGESFTQHTVGGRPHVSVRGICVGSALL